MLPGELGAQTRGQRQGTLCLFRELFGSRVSLQPDSSGWVDVQFRKMLDPVLELRSQEPESSFHHSPAYYLCLQDVLLQVAETFVSFPSEKRG